MVAVAAVVVVAVAEGGCIKVNEGGLGRGRQEGVINVIEISGGNSSGGGGGSRGGLYKGNKGGMGRGGQEGITSEK